MVHNGIEYGDMQLISEAYDVLKTVGGLTNDELVEAFNEWNKVRVRPILFHKEIACATNELHGLEDTSRPKDIVGVE